MSNAGPPISKDRILVVDDDVALRRTMTEYLEDEGFDVATAASSAEASAHLAQSGFHMVVLDLRLGRENGLDLLRALRVESEVPVIIVTGHRRDEVDRVVGLELGADDYLLKPFSLRELLARIRTVLKRANAPVQESPSAAPGTRVRFEGWTFDRQMRRLTNPQQQIVKLSKSEFALLSALLDAPGRPLSRDFLIEATRMHEDVLDRSIDVQVLRLRRKLEPNPSEPRMIKTERGFGYVLAVPVHVLA